MHFDHHAVRGELRIFDRFFERVHFRAEDSLGLKLGQPDRCGSIAKPRREERVQFGAMRLLLCVVRKFGLLREIAEAEGHGNVAHGVVGKYGRDFDVAVGGGEGFVDDRFVGAHAADLGDAGRVHRGGAFPRVRVKRHTQKIGRDALTETGAGACEECNENALHEHESGRIIG